MKTILAFNLTPERLSALKALAQRRGIAVTEVPGSRQGRTLGQLLGMVPAPAADGPVIPFRGELLVYAGLTPPEIFSLRDVWKKTREPLGLQAMLTPDNAGWTAVRLYTELNREASRLGKA